jgi:hypothetical protein
MRHFCPQVFRHQLLDAAVWQTPRQYSSQDFAAKAGIMTESAVANRAGSMENLAYAPIRCLCPQNGRWRVRREAADIEHRPPRG